MSGSYVACCVALLLGACVDSADRYGEARAAVAGGTPTTDDRAVVAVAPHRVACDDTLSVTCSGVLIAPRVVLTAAHCLDAMAPRGALEVAFGANAGAPTQVIVVDAAVVSPGYNALTGEGDVAALLLAAEAEVAPVPRPTAGIASVVPGSPLRAVGYGVSAFGANDPGTKRDGTLALAEVREASFDAIAAPQMTCTSDSGGPLFATIAGSEELVGLTSSGDAACIMTAVNARIDVLQATFIDPFVEASEIAAPSWPPELTAIDALVDFECTADADCPAVMTCIAGEAGARCGFPWLGAGTFGAACTNDAGCGGAPGERCARVWPDGADACHCFTPANPPPEPQDPGGCSAGGGALPLPIAVLLAQLGLLELARRRARNRVDKHERVG